MSDWTAVVQMVLLQKNKPPNHRKSPQSHDFPEKEDSERYHTQPWKEAWHLILLWPFSMCAKLEFYSATYLPSAKAAIRSPGRVRHAHQAGKADSLHGWSFLTPARENKAAGGRGRCASVSGRCSYFLQLPALPEGCTCMCRAGLRHLF